MTLAGCRRSLELKTCQIRCCRFDKVRHYVQPVIVSLRAAGSRCEIIIDRGKLPPKISVCMAPEDTKR